MKQRRTTEQITKNNTPEQLLYSIQQLDNLRDAALVSFIYLTGCRISEVVGKVKDKAYSKVINETSLDILPLKVEDVVRQTDDIILIQNVPCLKHRNKLPRRNIPLKLSSHDDRPFIDIFMAYFNTLAPGQSLFDITRQRCWQIINKKLGLYTHFLIHERCTELVAKRGLTDLYLKQLRGWKDTRPAEIYAHLKWQDLAEKL
jgi:site-specific recombinase XerD